MFEKIKLFAGHANQALATDVAKHLNMSLGKATVDRFSDGEIMVEILENVRGKEAFIIQSTYAPSNDHLMELVIMADALRRASVANITAVVPYFGYARQDRRIRSSRVPITAKVVADMLAAVGITRLITVDLHAEQIQGFFYMPVDNVYASSVMIENIKSRLLSHGDFKDLVVVSPDVGGVVRARAVAKRLNDADLVIIDKRRPSRNCAEVMNIIGDVDSRSCILVDDMVDTAGTLCQAAQALKAQGASSVIAYITHPVLSGNAVQLIAKSALDELLVTDTIPLKTEALECDKISTLSLSRMLAETIHRVSHHESVSTMFGDDSVSYA